MMLSVNICFKIKRLTLLYTKQLRVIGPFKTFLQFEEFTNKANVSQCSSLGQKLFIQKFLLLFLKFLFLKKYGQFVNSKFQQLYKKSNNLRPQKTKERSKRLEDAPCRNLCIFITTIEFTFICY